MSGGRFHAYLSRMKYIERWALMRNSMSENLCEHTLETAYIAHALGVISNRRCGGSVDIERLVLAAMYHDCSEILTGDLPTPVKYDNPKIKAAYKELETVAERKLLSMLPDDLREDYEPLFGTQRDKKTAELLKAADKLSAVIKCMQEEKAGNGEFEQAKRAQLEAISALGSPEANIFVEEFLPEYSLSLDELSAAE